MKYLIIIIQLATLYLIIKTKNEIMAKSDEIKALITEINDTTNNIAADIERIAAGITGGLTAAEASDVVAQLQATAAQLKTIAEVTPEV